MSEWPRLSAAARLAWAQLMASDLVGWRYGTISCDSLAVSTAMGVSDRRREIALDRLAAAGLVEVVRGPLDSRGRGRLIAIVTRDPRHVACPDAGQPAVVAGDPQRVLPLGDTTAARPTLAIVGDASSTSTSTYPSTHPSTSTWTHPWTTSNTRGEPAGEPATPRASSLLLHHKNTKKKKVMIPAVNWTDAAVTAAAAWQVFPPARAKTPDAWCEMVVLAGYITTALNNDGTMLLRACKIANGQWDHRRDPLTHLRGIVAKKLGMGLADELGPILDRLVVPHAHRVPPRSQRPPDTQAQPQMSTDPPCERDPEAEATLERKVAARKRRDAARLSRSPPGA